MAQSERPAKIPAKIHKSPNWEGMWVLHAKGMSLPELAQEFGIPYAKLAERARKADWEGLINRFPALRAPALREGNLPALPNADELEKAREKIERNRERNLTMAERIISQVQRLLDSAEKKKVIIPPKDIKSLAGAVASLAEQTMIALGDERAVRGPGMGKTGSERPLINITLPPVLAQLKQAEPAPPDKDEEDDGTITVEPDPPDPPPTTTAEDKPEDVAHVAGPQDPDIQPIVGVSRPTGKRIKGKDRWTVDLKSLSKEDNSEHAEDLD